MVNRCTKNRKVHIILQNHMSRRKKGDYYMYSCRYNVGIQDKDRC